MKCLLILLCSLSAFHAQRLEKVYTKGEYIFSVKTYKNGIQKDFKFSAKESESKSQFDFKSRYPQVNKVAFIGLQITGNKLKNKQEMIHWNYYDPNFNRLSQETTGLIQNASRVWLHPPRLEFFRMLELNPFPEIRFQKPLWDTKLEVGDSWADERWKTWEGKLIIISKYNYFKTKNKVVAEAHTGVGKTQLNLIFDPTFGFKTIDFTTINGLRFLMEYVKFEK